MKIQTKHEEVILKMAKAKKTTKRKTTKKKTVKRKKR